MKGSLGSLSKRELGEIIVYMADHSFGLREIFRRQFGESAKEEFENRIGSTLTRSKKGMQEELNQIIKSYPAAALWLMHQFFGLTDLELVRLSGESVHLILGSNLNPNYRANQLWFFMDLLYQQAEAQNFENCISMGTGLYFYVIGQWDKYGTEDAQSFEGFLMDFFLGLGYQLKETPEQAQRLYRQVVDQLDKNHLVYSKTSAKKIKQLARNIRPAS